jgi:hypothetical protein
MCSGTLPVLKWQAVIGKYPLKPLLGDTKGIDDFAVINMLLSF